MSEQPIEEAVRHEPVPKPRISVIGIGGAGGNAIDNMIRADLEGVEFVVANTDAQALSQSLCDNRIQLGATLTKGLGAGAQPEIGQTAAEQSIDAIAAALKGSNMAFITAGMGGGTGTGGAPVIARAAREEGVLTVGVVTKPFHFEGARRMRLAEAGIAELTQYVDTLIVIPNQNLFRVADENTTFADAFKLADEVLHSGVRGVTDLMVLPGLVNLDFADVRSIMAGMGPAVMGTGEAEGDNRAFEAAEAAISNPLLDDVSVKGARSVLVNITGGLDLMLLEVDEAANRIRAEVDPDANIIFGSAFSEHMTGKIRVSVIATGNVAENQGLVAPPLDRPFVGAQAAPGTTNSALRTGTVAAVEQGRDSAPLGSDATMIETAFSPSDVAAESKEASADDEPLTLRLVSNLPVTDRKPPAPSAEPEEPASPAESEEPAPPAEFAEPVFTAESAEPASPAEFSEAVLSAESAEPAPPVEFAEPVLSAEATEPLLSAESAEPAPPVEIAEPVLKAEPSEPAPPAESAEPEAPAEDRPAAEAAPAALYRPARPVKTESTLEAYESARAQESAATKTADVAEGAEKMHYLVWEIDLGARIYKVPQGKLASVRKQPHADRLQLFDDLDKAKGEVNAIFKRVADRRAARGLPRSILTPTLDEILRWDEEKVPSYFF